LLTPEQQAVLVISSLNLLPHPDDLTDYLAGKNDFGHGCCADCCAPCGILRDLRDAGTLDDIVRICPPHYWTGLTWWTPDGVDKNWLQACWSNSLCCEETT